jgi:hypothetical protein
MKFDNLVSEITESLNKIPKYLYHATYRPLLRRIKKQGLDSNLGKKNWDFSINGYIYLAIDPDIAESYAESSEEVSEDWLDEIIILVIDTDKIDKSKLFIDKNVKDNEGDTLEYRGIISPDALKIYA